MLREILITLRGLLIVTLFLWVVLILVYFPYVTDTPPTPADVAQLKTYYDVPRPPEPEAFKEPFTQLHQNVTRVVRDFAHEYSFERKKVLEIGSGTGYLQDVVDDYTGLDIGAGLKPYYHKPFVVGSATALPFPNSSFDGVWSFFVYEHVINPELGLSELRRVVKDGGVVMLLPAWNCNSWAAEGYAVRPYRDLTVKGKLIKASLMVRAKPLYQAVYRYPIRLLRRTAAAVWTGPARFRYRTLEPNYSHYWGSDGDAVNSLDRFEALRWFQTRGDECLNCDGRDFWRNDGALILRIHKQAAP